MRKRKKFPVPHIRQESPIIDDHTPQFPQVDLTFVDRLEWDKEEEGRFEVLDGTLFVGTKYLADAKTNAQTGGLYFDRGHPLYDIFSHNEPLSL